MGRPPLENPPEIVQIKLRLYPGEDDDLRRFFEQIPHGHRADAVKAALRTGNLGTVELNDLPSDEAMAADLSNLLL
jgi:hypothetical protein